jgi:hypothetical protein
MICDQFWFTGQYRVQSRRTSVDSSLLGNWFCSEPTLLDNERVNSALVANPTWLGKAFVTLRPAIIAHRSGQFLSEQDILYKKANFTPTPGTEPMPVDIVDVLKSISLWKRREPFVISLFDRETYVAVHQKLSELAAVVANEYYLHEAGHFLGYDVLRKYNEGYFTVGGKTAWPLIYLEELRADLHAFGFALELFSPELAQRVFLYNLFLRLGVHVAGVREKGIAPYGVIPYLLYHLLRSLGYLQVVRFGNQVRITLASLHTPTICEVMKQCAAHALEQITLPETGAPSQIDAAICGGRYVRQRVEDTLLADEFARVMHSCVTAQAVGANG